MVCSATLKGFRGFTKINMIMIMFETNPNYYQQRLPTSNFLRCQQNFTVLHLFSSLRVGAASPPSPPFFPPVARFFPPAPYLKLEGIVCKNLHFPHIQLIDYKKNTGRNNKLQPPTPIPNEI